MLRLPADPDAAAWVAAVRQRLLEARAHRAQPGRDDIVVLRSNGLAIRAMADAGAALGRPDWVHAAARAAAYLLEVHRIAGRWRRSSRDGVAGPGAAVLADHADLAAGLLALHQATGEPRWLSEAVAVLDLVLGRFLAADGGFNDTADDSEPLFLRPRDPADGAAPSGASAIVDALLTAGSLTGDSRYLRAAEGAMGTVVTLLRRVPRSAGWHLAAAEALVVGPLQVAVSGLPGAVRDLLALAARSHAPGGSVVVAGEPDSSELLAARPMVDGKPAAYVCRGFVCDRPVSSVDELTRLLVGKR